MSARLEDNPTRERELLAMSAAMARWRLYKLTGSLPGTRRREPPPPALTRAIRVLKRHGLIEECA